jgi:hypothetical protein
MVTCRECESEINQATEICPHCGADLTQSPTGESVIPKKKSLGKILLRWGILLGVLLAAIWSFLWFVVSPRTGNVALEAETQAVQSMDEVHSALTDYASAQGGIYPETLDVLGPEVRVAAQRAQGEGYHLQYMAGPAGPDGALRSYTLEARAGNYSYRNFYSDTSGVIRSTRENRDANSLDPPIR